MPLTNGIYHEGRGQGDQPVLICSPDLAGSGEHWAGNAKALSKHFRVIMYDHRGTARSDRNFPAPATIAAMADDVVKLMDSLDVEDAHFMGQGMGGLVGLSLALRAPERMNRIVAVNAWSTLDPHINRLFDAMLSLAREAGAEAFLRALPLFTYPANWVSENHATLEERLVEHIAEYQGLNTLERRIAAMRAFNIASHLSEIQAPTLVIAAADDAWAPSLCSRHLAQALPDATLHVLPYGGHACNIVAPEFDELVIQWLNAVA